MYLGRGNIGVSWNILLRWMIQADKQKPSQPVAVLKPTEAAVCFKLINFDALCAIARTIFEKTPIGIESGRKLP